MPVASVKVHTPTDSPKAERRPWRCERGETCRSPRHHDSTKGYRGGCRSGSSRVAASREKAAYRKNPNRLIDSTGTARRLQALHAIGYGNPQLAARLFVSTQRVHELRIQKWPTVTRATADSVAWLYIELSEDPPTGRAATIARGSAAKLGEQPPEAWDPDTDAIDDPGAEPYAWRPSGWDEAVAARRERRTRERQERMAEVADLERAGLTVEQIARSLDVSARTVHRNRAELNHQEAA
jgi:hypothetical protein